jgi:hypothetical protein
MRLLRPPDGDGNGTREGEQADVDRGALLF